MRNFKVGDRVRIIGKTRGAYRLGDNIGLNIGDVVKIRELRNDPVDRTTYYAIVSPFGGAYYVFNKIDLQPMNTIEI